MSENSKLFKIKISTSTWHDLVVVTEKVQEILNRNKIDRGICFLFVPHSTASLTINSYLDPDTGNDLNSEINRLIPTRIDFQHIRDTPTDASGHIKASLIGPNLFIFIDEGKLILGRSQGIFFWEFDGPRNREIFVKIIED